MTDPQDELSARFDDRRPDSDTTDTADHTDEDTEPDHGRQPAASAAAGDSPTTENPSHTGQTGNTDTTHKPGPDPTPDATRHRRQVPLYLPEQQADQLDALYQRLDGQSKVAGDGGIEKHADFMETLVEFALDHDDALADRLEIDT